MTQSGENVFTFIPERKLLPNRRFARRQTTLRPVTFVASWIRDEVTQSQPNPVTNQNDDDNDVDDIDRCHSQPCESSKPSNHQEDDSESPDDSLEEQGDSDLESGEKEGDLETEVQRAGTEESSALEKSRRHIPEEMGESEEEVDESEMGEDLSQHQVELVDQSGEDSDPGEVDGDPGEIRRSGQRQEDLEESAEEEDESEDEQDPQSLSHPAECLDGDGEDSDPRDVGGEIRRSGRRQEDREESAEDDDESEEEQDPQSLAHPAEFLDDGDDDSGPREVDGNPGEICRSGQRQEDPEESAEEDDESEVEQDPRSLSHHAECLDESGEDSGPEGVDPVESVESEPEIQQGEPEPGEVNPDEEDEPPLQDRNEHYQGGAEELDSEDGQEMLKPEASTNFRDPGDSQGRSPELSINDDCVSDREDSPRPSRRNSSLHHIDVSGSTIGDDSPNHKESKSPAPNTGKYPVGTTRQYTPAESMRRLAQQSRHLTPRQSTSKQTNSAQSMSKSPSELRLQTTRSSSKPVGESQIQNTGQFARKSSRRSRLRATLSSSKQAGESRIQNSGQSASKSASQPSPGTPPVEQSLLQSRCQTRTQTSSKRASDSQLQNSGQSMSKSLRQSRHGTPSVEQLPRQAVKSSIQSTFQTTPRFASNKSQLRNSEKFTGKSVRQSRLRTTIIEQSPIQSRPQTPIQSASKSTGRPSLQTAASSAVKLASLRQSTLQFQAHAADQSRLQSPVQSVSQTGRRSKLCTPAKSMIDTLTQVTPRLPADSRSVGRASRILHEQESVDEPPEKSTRHQPSSSSVSSSAPLTPSSRRQTLNDPDISFSIVVDEEQLAVSKKTKKLKKVPKIQPPIKPKVKASQNQRKRPAPSDGDENEDVEEEEVDPSLADRSVHIWCGGKRKRTARDITDLDAILSGIEERAYEFKRGLNSTASRRAVTKFFTVFQEGMTDMIDSIGEMKHHRSSLRKAAADVKSLQEELLDIEKESNRTQCEVYKLKSGRTTAKSFNPVEEWMSKTQAFLTRYRDSVKVAL